MKYCSADFIDMRYGFFAGVNRCIMNHSCALWQNVCKHNFGNIRHTKLKIGLGKLNRLVFVWLNAKNIWRKSGWFLRVQTISRANYSKFLTIFGQLLPPNSSNSCPNGLKILENVLLVKLHKLCVKHDHWSILAYTAFFKKAFLGNKKKSSFLPIFCQFLHIYFCK